MKLIAEKLESTDKLSHLQNNLQVIHLNIYLLSTYYDITFNKTTLMSALMKFMGWWSLPTFVY